MDKRQLQLYAVWAKDNLETQVEVSLKTLGIFSDNDIRNAKVVGDVTVIEGDDNSYPKELYAKRNSIVNLVKEEGYKQVIEELAYTWFNRFVALRLMEVHDFIPHGFRVLSSRDGSVEPEILKNLSFVKDELKLDMNTCATLSDKGNIEELYRYVFLRQCEALAKILPMLFQDRNDYLELLLPKTLLLGETVLTKLLELGEEPFLSNVEVIGWLYQFYISKKKAEVFASKKTITKDTLPAVTQLFTPDWIVRYMAENSIGRLWLESNPSSSLKDSMKYYVKDAEQEPEVAQRIAEIKYTNTNPEEIKVIEPCCGSGHILVYVFDLLYKMYEEKGYSPREIPTLILSKNIFGLEIDRRAAQLASFSLVMKARELNNRFFNSNYYVMPNVLEIHDSRFFLRQDYKKELKELNIITTAEMEAVSKLVETFRYGKTIGSLLRMPKIDVVAVESTIKKLSSTDLVLTVFNSEFVNRSIKYLSILLNQYKIMADKYDVMITNPPYIGISGMETPVKDYAVAEYPDSKTDMFAMFMETNFVKKNGFTAMINMHSWMFLKSYEELRKKIIQNSMIVNMLHLGARAFEEIGGEVVQTTSFVIRNSKIACNGVYYRLVDEKDKESAFLTGGGITFDIQAFLAIPSNIFSYWISKEALLAFQTSKRLGELYDARNGFTTGSNDKFLRFWYEVKEEDICFDSTDYIFAFATGKTWFPYNKGGSFRKWYGNQDYIVDWKSDGKRIKEFGHLVPRSMNYMFFESISWSKISTGTISFRWYPQGFMFDVAGLSMFATESCNIEKNYILALINSTVANYYLKMLSPTLNFETGQISSLPIILSEDRKDNVKENVASNIKLAKTDWDCFEESWNFKKHPLI